ncbi:MAG: Uma2 family endonuclease [Leptolyngbyaceae cyanobacterium SM1_1_3]|nr:Uma2 family endonuclease [Leptolyngbyaceae cyanobacterium SM1_1_3]NJN03505.1 Uma2 family endonuclease [Leptolyngbyaceae cyanobacterium RM1_1_2]
MPEPLAADRLKWSVPDYHRLVEAGILGDRRVELLGGDLIEMSLETPIHYSTAKQDARYLESLLSGKADVRFNGPITLVDSEPEPDIAVVRLPDSQYETRHPGLQDIYWLIEIAKTSFATDRVVKAAIYAAAGIPEYWIVHLAERQLYVLRSPRQHQYTEESVLSVGTIQPLAFPEVAIAVEKLLLHPGG